ncbi:MAG: transposase, partial [Acinetobacter sp.]|nr:transposase [Acinetobacter sp.]
MYGVTDKRNLKARALWIKSYFELGSVSKAARKCGIPRSTLYRWIARYKQSGKDGLQDFSKKPHRLARVKITNKLEQLILETRKQHKFGPQRIQTYLLREHNIKLSSPTIWRVLQKHDVKPLKRYRSPKVPIRYSRPVPGDRVQIDVMKVRKGCYQFTAIDDCTRLRVLRLYDNKKAESSVDFLRHVLDNMPFPVQRIQTDWGTEFFAENFQYELMEHFIKFRPIKPRSPHLNGKVERSQKS